MMEKLEELRKMAKDVQAESKAYGEGYTDGYLDAIDDVQELLERQAMPKIVRHDICLGVERRLN